MKNPISIEQRSSLNRAYVLNDKITYYITDKGIPYELRDNSRFIPTVRKESLICGGFHNHYTKRR